MTALTSDRNTARRDGVAYQRGLAAGAVAIAGGIAVLNAGGFSQPGTTATGLVADGIYQETVANTGANGAIAAPVLKGVFRLANSAAADLITIAEIGDICFIVDDQTVAKTDATGTRSAAGVIKDVDADGVWVEFA